MSLYIMVLSLLTAVSTSYVSFQNPQLRWQQLRAAAREIESEIFVFRTRTNKYRAILKGQLSFTRNDEVIFQEHLKSIQDRVLESADLKKTIFFSFDKTKQYKHGQHRGAAWQKKAAAKNVEEDDHHSPLQPLDYVS